MPTWPPAALNSAPCCLPLFRSHPCSFVPSPLPKATLPSPEARALTLPRSGCSLCTLQTDLVQTKPAISPHCLGATMTPGCCQPPAEVLTLPVTAGPGARTILHSAGTHSGQYKDTHELGPQGSISGCSSLLFCTLSTGVSSCGASAPTGLCFQSPSLCPVREVTSLPILFPPAIEISDGPMSTLHCPWFLLPLLVQSALAEGQSHPVHNVNHCASVGPWLWDILQECTRATRWQHYSELNLCGDSLWERGMLVPVMGEMVSSESLSSDS